MTISGKLRRAFWGAGLVLIVNLVAVAGLMTIIKGNVRHMAERQMAAEAAVAGMIDAVEDGRRMVEMGAAGASVQTGEVPDLGAFPEHAKKFLELTQSSEQRTLGEQAQASYKEFATVRDQLIDANSKQLAAMKELEETGEIMHGVNRDKFLASIRKSTPYAQKKTDRVLEMDRSLELVANIVADYHQDPKPEAKDELAKALGEYEDAMVVYKRTGLYGDENEWYRQYRRTYTKFKDSARGVMDQEDARRKVLANFDKAYAAMSEILVDKLQPMVADDAVSTKSTALRLGDLTMAIALALAVAGIVFGFIGVRLVASEVNEDVAALVYATDQVGRGVLEYKVELSSKNELGEIQDGINRMIDQLVVVRDDKARQMSDMKDSVDKYRQIAEDVTQAHERRRRAEVLDAVTTLSAGIGRSLGKVFSTVKGSLAAAMDHIGPGEDGRAQLEDAYAAVEGAEGLVDHVGRLSREQDLARKPIVLHPVINEAVKQLKEIAPKGVTVNADVDTDCGHVMADGARVLQAVLNLGRNAIEAVGDSGQVDIELKLREITPELAELSPRLDPQRSYVVIRVKDNGVGMSTATQARAFEPFYSRGDAKGAGLGLAVVRGIVLAHDGEILLDSEPGEGTTIEILLPPSITGIVASEEAQDDWRGDAHVLVVDSDKDTADSIAEALKALGYRVTSRTNASDAIAAFQALADDVSVAIVSQDLEPIPGAELAETLRRINVDLAVILTADFGQEPTDEELARVGAVGKLKKPVIGNDLAKIVKMAVTSREA